MRSIRMLGPVVLCLGVLYSTVAQPATPEPRDGRGTAGGRQPDVRGKTVAVAGNVRVSGAQWPVPALPLRLTCLLARRGVVPAFFCELRSGRGPGRPAPSPRLRGIIDSADPVGARSRSDDGDGTVDLDQR